MLVKSSVSSLIKAIGEFSFAPSPHTGSGFLLSAFSICSCGCFCSWSLSFVLVFLHCVRILGCPFTVKSEALGVPVVAQWLMNPTGNHEVAGSVPALAQRVNDPALP